MGVGLLARKQAGTGVEWNVFNGFNSRPGMAPGEGRLGLSLGFQGGLGPASLNIDAISAGMPPLFGVDALSRLALTWQYQRKGAQQ